MENLGKKLVRKFDEEIRFFKGWIEDAKGVGAILPTSSVTSRSMASVINPESGLPVLELGPGTGVITKAIIERGVKPENLYSIEYSEEFVEHLRIDFPEANIIHGDAFQLDTTLGGNRGLTFDSVISAVPLLSFPMNRRLEFIDDLLDRIPVGRPVVQITYGPRSPIPPGKGNYVVKHHDFVVRNFPPAQLWLYTRGTSG